jgi:hypothetical protein
MLSRRVDSLTGLSAGLSAGLISGLGRWRRCAAGQHGHRQDQAPVIANGRSPVPQSRNSMGGLL